MAFKIGQVAVHKRDSKPVIYCGTDLSKTDGTVLWTPLTGVNYVNRSWFLETHMPVKRDGRVYYGIAYREQDQHLEYFDENLIEARRGDFMVALEDVSRKLVHENVRVAKKTDADSKKTWGAILMSLGIIINLIGYYVYMGLLPTDLLAPDYLSRFMYAYGVQMTFLAIGGIMSLIGFILLLDWFKSK
jgi:hypothetical protein